MTRIATTLALAAALSLPTAVLAQPSAAAPMGHPMPATAARPDGAMMADCQAMMTKKKEMKEHLAAMDATLAKLVTAMNAAANDKKADAMERPIAAVVTELVSQRKSEHVMAAEMDEAMMAHMMRHMQMGKDGMAHCPMMSGMKSMKGMDHQSGVAHEDHQRK